MHNLNGHSLQFIIFIIKTLVILSRVLGKKWHFVQWGYKAVFVPVFQCHALKRHRPIDKKCNFFLHLIS